MARCVILSACPVSPALAGLLREDDFIIACDAGYRNCAPLHCKPHVIVGDFDTAPCPQQEDDEIVVLPHVKDDTDTEYAAKLAVQKGFDEVLLLGGLGGRRLEHTLANLCTGLGLEKRGVRVMLQDERSRITFVMPGETRRYPKEDYFYFSAFPMEGRAEGVCEQGSYYELTDAELTAGYPLGVSNEYAEGSDCITVSTREGALVTVLYSLADTLFVGMMNDQIQNAAVALAAPALLAFNAVINLFGIGSSSMMSRALGRGDLKTVCASASLGFYGTVVSGALLSALCYIFMQPFVVLLGGCRNDLKA